ncbi:MAG: hypothetical protein E7393_04660 [Ruminococcaceae bacterium]|nr:hypothetical protein [Oscillospiraceae bacterium]
MEMKYYNASNHFKAPIPREPKPYMTSDPRHEIVVPQKPIETYHEQKEFFQEDGGSLSCEPTEKGHDVSWISDKDDLILLGLILLLLFNNCEDYFLLLILGYIFLAGKSDTLSKPKL